MANVQARKHNLAMKLNSFVFNGIIKEGCKLWHRGAMKALSSHGDVYGSKFIAAIEWREHYKYVFINRAR